MQERLAPLLRAKISYVYKKHIVTMDEAILVGTGLVATLVSGAVWGGEIGAVSRERPTSITPRDAAFGIWGVIYTLLAASTIYVATSPHRRTTTVPWWAALVATSEVLAALWIPLFSQSRAFVLSACVLCAACVAATAALSTMPPLFLEVATSMFAGWLWCAAALGVVLALPSSPKAVLVALAFVVGGVAVGLRAPALIAPCAWLLLMQPDLSSSPVILGLCVCAASAAAAVWRRV